MKRSANKMDTIFYLTILAGLLTVVLSGITYYKGKQKEIEADKANKGLLEKTNQVVVLQRNLLNEMGKSQEKSDTIISIQNKLQDANEKILVLSNKNVKQVLGDGAPTLSAHFYPDKLIALSIQNNNDYPIYDISLVFPNPDTYSSAKKMAEEGRILSWEEMRNQWINVPAFNLPPKTVKNFYSFYLPEQMQQTSCFLNIVSRHAAFSGSIFIKRIEQGFTFKSEVADLHGKKLTENDK
jgi:hypothetical protein